MYYYIINPAAGNGRIDKIQNRLKEIIKSLGIDGEMVKTTGPADVYKLTDLALKKSCQTIVAVGGDSTVNEVANALIDKKAVLGIIPIGRTNSVAKTLGIESWEEACQILAARKLEKIDLAKISNIPQTDSLETKTRFFLTSVEIGLESKINKFRNEKSFFYKISLVQKIIKEILNLKEEKLTLEINEDFTATTEMITVIVANCCFSLLNREFKPNPADKQLDVLIISKLPKISLLRNIRSIIKGNYENLSQLSIFKAKNIKLITSKPIELSIDGEPIMQTPAEIEIVPEKLKIIVGKKRVF
ncbi:MAG: diacylglycerol/lipid kinase family protein [Minisyncoccia bacterium]